MNIQERLFSLFGESARQIKGFSQADTYQDISVGNPYLLVDVNGRIPTLQDGIVVMSFQRVDSGKGVFRIVVQQKTKGEEMLSLAFVNT